jgi:hypothetical protein
MFNPLRVLTLLLLSGSLVGCGGGGGDPFDRAPITGTVSVGGEPVEFGSITFEGEKNEATQEVALAVIPIRQGKFDSSAAGRSPSPGTNEVTVTVYDGDPDSEEREAPVRGTWLGQEDVEAGEEIKIDINPEDLVGA